MAMADSASPDEIFVLALISILSAGCLLTLDLRTESFNLFGCLRFRFAGFCPNFPRAFL